MTSASCSSSLLVLTALILVHFSCALPRTSQQQRFMLADPDIGAALLAAAKRAAPFGGDALDAMELDGGQVLMLAKARRAPAADELGAVRSFAGESQWLKAMDNLRKPRFG